MMNSKFSVDEIGSAELRRRLEVQLLKIFSSNAICKYLNIDGSGSELQLFNDRHIFKTFPHIKLAFNIWLGMNAMDRCQVLRIFHQLYATLPIADRGDRKTLVFCALFINEFVTTLTGLFD